MTSGGGVFRREQPRQAAWQREFDAERVDEGFHVWLKVIRFWCLLSVVETCYTALVADDAACALSAVPTTLLGVGTFGLSHWLVGLTSEQLRGIMGESAYTIKVGLQLGVPALGMSLRLRELLHVPGGPMAYDFLHVCVRYHIPAMASLFLQSCVAHLPDHLYFGVCLPVWLSGWLCFHLSVSSADAHTAVLGGITLLALCYYCRGAIDEVQWEKFVTARGLLEARLQESALREQLQQQVDAQEAMCKSMFDATILCDSMGSVVRASPHADALFRIPPGGSLEGRMLRGFCASAGEASRLDKLLADTLASPANQAQTCQGSFLIEQGPSVDLSLNAVRQAWRNPGSWGVLIGLQLVSEAQDRTDNSRALEEEEPAEPPQIVSDSSGGFPVESAESVWLRFDAGSPNFIVSDGAPEMIQILPGWLDWVPSRHRDSVETWVTRTVNASVVAGGARTRSNVVEQVSLALPTAHMLAESAYLEVEPTEEQEEEADDETVQMPTILRLQGVTWRRRPPTSVSLSDSVLGALMAAQVTPDDSQSQAGERLFFAGLRRQIGD